MYMKNLSYTIDRLIKIDPDLRPVLEPIKARFKKRPSMACWKDLLAVLNSDQILSHPKRMEMKNVLISKSHRQVLYTFESTCEHDKIIGIIPEHIADKLRKHDRQCVELAKMHTAATLTHDEETMTEWARKDARHELESKKIWLDLRDHFGLWGHFNSYSIKKNKGSLVLVEPASAMGKFQFLAPGIVKMDPDTLRQFLKSIGLDENQIPDGLLGD